MNLEELKREHLSNPHVKAEYDALEPEFQVIRAMIEARREKHLTRKCSIIRGLTCS